MFRNPRLAVVLLASIIFLYGFADSAQANEGRKIATAVQRGSFVYVYDEKGSQMFILSAGGGEKDGLAGYTSTTVSIRRGSFIYIYNEKGSQVSTVSAGN
jgi:hypothetical protein